MLTLRCHLVRRSARHQTTRAAVERNVVVHVDHSPVVYVRHVHRPDVHDRAVIKKRAAMPVTALESNTGIPAAVIDSTIEADVRAPVTAVPDVSTAPPTPVSRSPEQARLGRQHPGARHPVIAVIAISPIARRPDVARRRERRLHVHRQHRRRHRDRHTDRNAGLRNCWEYGERGQRQRRNQTL